MSTTMTARKARPGTVVLWAVQGIVAIGFVMAAVPKLAGDQTMIDIFDAVGAGQWLRYVVGLLELAGAIGLLIPRLTGLAALGLTALMVGASLTNILALHASPAIPIVYLLLAAAIAWFRRASIRALVQR